MRIFISMHVWICVYVCVCCVTMHICKHELLCAVYVFISVSNSKGWISFTKDNFLFLNSLFKQNFYTLLENMGTCLSLSISWGAEAYRSGPITWMFGAPRSFLYGPSSKPCSPQLFCFQGSVLETRNHGNHGNQRDPSCVECRFPLNWLWSL